jgi:lipocalin
MRFTLFILSRTPELDAETLDMLIEDLQARGFDANRIQTIPQQSKEL